MQADVAIVGAGAAGLATAIFAARRNPKCRLVALDGANKLGAKILVSGGGRCNVTNTVVTEADFWGGSRNLIRRVLRAFPAEQTIHFFREIGVTLHEEEHGKLFPDTHSARTVLQALLNEAKRLGVAVLPAHRVVDVTFQRRHFIVTSNVGEPRLEARADDPRDLPQSGPREPARAEGRGSEFERHDSVLSAKDGGLRVGTIIAPKVVLATGGMSLPKTGSDGTGYRIAQHLGHSLIPATPALAPLILEGDFHVPLSGISQEIELTVRVPRPSHSEGTAGGTSQSAIRNPQSAIPPIRLRGAMLWTHFGVSGPVIMNASRFWHRAKLESRTAQLLANFLPGESFESAEKRLIELAQAQPKTFLHNALATLLPARVALAVLQHLHVGADKPMAHVSRDDRRKLVHALLEWPLPVRDSRGFNYAEVTAGGVPLEEIDPATMESRKCPGLYLVGEILDVDGRIGGFNFQWSWSSARVAASALAAV